MISSVHGRGLGGGDSFEIRYSAHAIRTTVTRPFLEIRWPVLPFLLSPQNPNKNKFESKEEDGRGESQEVGVWIGEG